MRLKKDTIHKIMLAIHFSEIILKGKNRRVFENKLIENLKIALKVKKITKKSGRLLCQVEEKKEIVERLKNFPGIDIFYFAEECDLDLERVKRRVIKFLEKEEFEKFKVETHRANKEFPKTSVEINKIIGEAISKELNKKVDLKNPDLVVRIDVLEDEILISKKVYKGIGGLPVSTGGRVVCLLSGGIDSPVAAWAMMKRGCKVIFVHFFNSTFATLHSLKKVERIVKKLSEVQLNSKLYLVPFENIQREIIKNIPAKYRTIIYRRSMLRIASLIAEKEKAKALVTGDSLGQVASQTLENLYCIYSASKFPALSPLIGFNKKEIIDLAKKIGTYEISILPYPDCCSLLVSKHPETKGDPEKIISLEKNLEALEDKAFKSAKVKEFYSI